MGHIRVLLFQCPDHHDYVAFLKQVLKGLLSDGDISDCEIGIDSSEERFKRLMGFVINDEITEMTYLKEKNTVFFYPRTVRGVENALMYFPRCVEEAEPLPSEHGIWDFENYTDTSGTFVGTITERFRQFFFMS